MRAFCKDTFNAIQCPLFPIYTTLHHLIWSITIHYLLFFLFLFLIMCLWLQTKKKTKCVTKSALFQIPLWHSLYDLIKSLNRERNPIKGFLQMIPFLLRTNTSTGYNVLVFKNTSHFFSWFFRHSHELPWFVGREKKKAREGPESREINREWEWERERKRAEERTNFFFECFFNFFYCDIRTSLINTRVLSNLDHFTNHINWYIHHDHF